MNRGKNKLLVTGILVVVSVIAALVISVIIGSSGGGAATPSKTTTTTVKPGVGAVDGATGSLGARTYQTVGSFVNLRSQPSTLSAVITNMHALGSPILLSCYVRGTSVYDDPWWYRATYSGLRGYVSGYWVNTGPDPAKTRLPAC